jgi:hypothetical protein
MGELESIASESGMESDDMGRSATRWTVSEWARPATSRAYTATGTGTGRLDFVELMYSYIVLINGFDLKKNLIRQCQIYTPFHFISIYCAPALRR